VLALGLGRALLAAHRCPQRPILSELLDLLKSAYLSGCARPARPVSGFRGAVQCSDNARIGDADTHETDDVSRSIRRGETMDAGSGLSIIGLMPLASTVSCTIKSQVCTFIHQANTAARATSRMRQEQASKESKQVHWEIDPLGIHTDISYI
jgi:hypothetical protein